MEIYMQTNRSAGNDHASPKWKDMQLFGETTRARKSQAWLGTEC